MASTISPATRTLAAAPATFPIPSQAALVRFVFSFWTSGSNLLTRSSCLLSARIFFSAASISEGASGAGGAGGSEYIDESDDVLLAGWRPAALPSA